MCRPGLSITVPVTLRQEHDHELFGIQITTVSVPSKATVLDLKDAVRAQLGQVAVTSFSYRGCKPGLDSPLQDCTDNSSTAPRFQATYRRLVLDVPVRLPKGKELHFSVRCAASLCTGKHESPSNQHRYEVRHGEKGCSTQGSTGVHGSLDNLHKHNACLGALPHSPCCCRAEDADSLEDLKQQLTARLGPDLFRTHRLVQQHTKRQPHSLDPGSRLFLEQQLHLAVALPSGVPLPE